MDAIPAVDPEVDGEQGQPVEHVTAPPAQNLGSGSAGGGPLAGLSSSISQIIPRSATSVSGSSGPSPSLGSQFSQILGGGGGEGAAGGEAAAGGTGDLAVLAAL
jgi:hypothetical protein